MSFRKRQASRAREHPITDRHQLWAAWFMGAASHHHPGRVGSPVHPDTAREFQSGAAAAASGFIIVPDLARAWELARHVGAGNPPHSFKGQQLGMAL